MNAGQAQGVSIRQQGAAARIGGGKTNDITIDAALSWNVIHYEHLRTVVYTTNSTLPKLSGQS